MKNSKPKFHSQKSDYKNGNMDTQVVGRQRTQMHNTPQRTFRSTISIT